MIWNEFVFRWQLCSTYISLLLKLKIDWNKVLFYWRVKTTIYIRIFEKKTKVISKCLFHFCIVGLSHEILTISSKTSYIIHICQSIWAINAHYFQSMTEPQFLFSTFTDSTYIHFLNSLKSNYNTRIFYRTYNSARAILILPIWSDIVELVCTS